MGAIAYTTATLASAVADDGTFTVSYPTGFTQALLIGSTGGAIVVGENDVWLQGSDPGVTFTFGSSNITVTNLTGRSLPAGSVIALSFGDSTKSGSYNPAIKVPGPVALTAATGTASDTIADVGVAFTQATLNNNFKSLASKINEILTRLDDSAITR